MKSDCYESYPKICTPKLFDDWRYLEMQLVPPWTTPQLGEWRHVETLAMAGLAKVHRDDGGETELKPQGLAQTELW